MGVRITDSENVALYDSTGGHAFGETFESAEAAQAFLDWLTGNGEGDPRNLADGQLGTLRAEWEAGRDV